MDQYDINYGSDPLDNFNFDDELSSSGAFFERSFGNGADALNEIPLPDVLEPTAEPSPPTAFPLSGVSFSAVSQLRQQTSGPLGAPAQPQRYEPYDDALSASDMRVSVPSASAYDYAQMPPPSASYSQVDAYPHTDPNPPMTIQPLYIPPGGRVAPMPQSAGYRPQAGSQAQVSPTPQSACYSYVTPQAYMSPHPQLPGHNYGGATNACFNDTICTPYTTRASAYEPATPLAGASPFDFAAAGNMPHHPQHGRPVTVDSSQFRSHNHQTSIYGERGVVQRPTNDTNPLDRGFGFYKHVSNDEPWTAKRLSFGKAIKNEKVSRKTRRKKTSSGDKFNSKDFYGNPPPCPEPWGQERNGGHTFEYTEEGELKHALELSELKWYLYSSPSPSIQHKWLARKPAPGEILLETKSRAGLILWIGKVPSQSNYRYPSDDSSKCKLRGCPRKKNSIKAGEFRVIFDERHNVTGRDIDPYYNSGFVHLYCLEKSVDLVELFDHLDVRLDQRTFEKEDANHCELKPELVEAARKWMSEQWPRYLHWRRQDTRPRRRVTTFMESLTKALTEADMKSESRGKPRQRAKRREAASQKAMAISCDREAHMGDIDMESAYRQARLDGDDDVARRLYPGQEWNAYLASLASRDELRSTHKRPRLADPSHFNAPQGPVVTSESYSQQLPAHPGSRVPGSAANVCAPVANMAVPTIQNLACPDEASLATVGTLPKVSTKTPPSRETRSQQAHVEQIEQFAVDLEGLEQYTAELKGEGVKTEVVQEPLPLPVMEGMKSPAAESDLWDDSLLSTKAGESVVVDEGASGPRAVAAEATSVVGPGPQADSTKHVVGSPVETCSRSATGDDALPPPPLTAMPSLPGLKRRRDADAEGKAGSNANKKRRRSV